MKWAETHLLLRKCMAVSLASSSSERACVCWVLQMAVARSLDLGACTLNTCTEWTVSSALRAAGRGGGKRNRGWVRSETSTSTSTAGIAGTVPSRLSSVTTRTSRVCKPPSLLAGCVPDTRYRVSKASLLEDLNCFKRLQQSKQDRAGETNRVKHLVLSVLTWLSCVCYLLAAFAGMTSCLASQR